jgi:uncharacterized OsmC-like protein
VLTLAAVAANKGISPEQIDVQIRRQSEEGSSWQTRFEVQVDLGDGLTRRERIILFNSARRCEVNKMLNGEIWFDYRLEPSGAG